MFNYAVFPVLVYIIAVRKRAPEKNRCDKDIIKNMLLKTAQ